MKFVHGNAIVTGYTSGWSTPLNTNISGHTTFDASDSIDSSDSLVSSEVLIRDSLSTANIVSDCGLLNDSHSKAGTADDDSFEDLESTYTYLKDVFNTGMIINTTFDSSLENDPTCVLQTEHLRVFRNNDLNKDSAGDVTSQDSSVEISHRVSSSGTLVQKASENDPFQTADPKEGISNDTVATVEAEKELVGLPVCVNELSVYKSRLVSPVDRTKRRLPKSKSSRDIVSVTLLMLYNYLRC